MAVTTSEGRTLSLRINTTDELGIPTGKTLTVQDASSDVTVAAITAFVKAYDSVYQVDSELVKAVLGYSKTATVAPGTGTAVPAGMDDYTATLKFTMESDATKTKTFTVTDANPNITAGEWGEKAYSFMEAYNAVVQNDKLLDVHTVVIAGTTQDTIYPQV